MTSNPANRNPLKPMFYAAIAVGLTDIYQLYQATSYTSHNFLLNLSGFVGCIVFILLYKRKSKFAWHLLLLVIPIIPIFLVLSRLGIYQPIKYIFSELFLSLVWIVFIFGIFSIRPKYMRFITSTT